MNGAPGQIGQGAAGAAGGFPQGGPPGGVGMMGGRGGLLGGPFMSIGLLILLAVTLIVLAIAFWRISKNAGFSSMLGLLMLIPVVNLGVALYVAFAAWPLRAELDKSRLIAASYQQSAQPVNATTSDPTQPAAAMPVA